MLNKKILFSLLAIITISISFYLFSKDEKTNNTINISSNTKLKSIADPNWWKKSSDKLSTSNKVKKSSQQVTNNAEPINNFIKFPQNNNWVLIKGKKGISSAKYSLVFEGKYYELAIIRMNASVALESVLSIWKNKVGLDPKSPFTSSLFLTNSKQELQLIPLIGSQKAILLAVHKNKKHTFFRLLGEQGIDKNAENKFKELLSEIIILH